MEGKSNKWVSRRKRNTHSQMSPPSPKSQMSAAQLKSHVLLKTITAHLPYG